MSIVELAAWIIVLVFGVPLALGALTIVLRVLMHPFTWIVGLVVMLAAGFSS